MEFRKRVSWETTRWHACILLNAKLKKGARRLRPVDIAVFDWEIGERDAMVQNIRNMEPEVKIISGIYTGCKLN